MLGGLAAGAGLAGGYLALRPDGSPNAQLQPAEPPFDPGRPVTLGFIYLGDGADHGYNQSHASAARALGNLPWTRITEANNVPEDAGVLQVMQRMIEEDGAEFVFPTSYGYFDPHLLAFAPKFPQVRFLHTGGLALPGHPPNISSSYGYIDEAMFLCGIVAAHTVGGADLGFVGAIPIPVVLRNINAFTLGARQVHPDTTVKVRFTGGWFKPEAETAITADLIRTGAQAVACHVDSPVHVMRTCESQGAYAIGYHVDQSKNAPTRFLTGAEWRWRGMYERYVERHLKGESWPTMYRGGLRDGTVALSPLSAQVPAAAHAALEPRLQEARADRLRIYTGPILSNTGEVMIPHGANRRQDDPWLETMDWFVDGVQTTS